MRSHTPNHKQTHTQRLSVEPSLSESIVVTLLCTAGVCSKIILWLLDFHAYSFHVCAVSCRAPELKSCVCELMGLFLMSLLLLASIVGKFPQ